MVWCAGYLGRSSLVTFLKKAKLQLSRDSNMTRRSFVPDSFIIVLDNVLRDNEDPDIVKGQWIRSEQQLETIFAEAGLIVYARSERHPNARRLS